MNRSRVITAAVFLAILGAVLPLALMGYVSWVRALSHEQALLDRYAQRALTNVGISLEQGRQAIAAMEAWRGAACSPGHIAEMRRMAVNTRSIEEIGYFEDGRLRCTAWGPTTAAVLDAPPDAEIAGGFQLTLRVLPQVSQGDPVTILRRGAYNVLINTSRLSDVILDERVQLGIVFGGQVISDLRATDKAFIAEAAGEGPAARDKRFLHAVARQDGWSAVVAEPVADIGTSPVRELLWMAPIGLLISGFIVALVVRLMRKRLSPLAELAIAVEQKEFVVFYQPLIELATGKCIGAEALVRWRRPDGSMVRPDLFIPLAEESGLIRPITDQVIQAAVHDLRDLLVSDRSLHVAINLCAEDMLTGRFIAVVEKAIERSGIAHEQVWLEATERGFMNVDAASASLAQARALGFGIAIDDFGTGYSSLQYLEHLPTDTLKIDKSFIDAIGTASAPSAVTTHIIGMAKALKLKIVAEGVETEAQADFLRAHGVDFAQGWLYAKALPSAEFIAFARRR